jgi:glycosyltransferase involved in cell wall biosynthesis
LFTRLLHEGGHEVIIRAFYGLNGAKLNHGGIEVLPGGLHGFGEDVLRPDWLHYRPDAHVILADLWVYNPDILQTVPFSFWCPIDHEPLPPLVAQRLPFVRHVWAMSRFGERQMRAHGFDPHYVPHGVETRLFTPIHRTAGRDILGVKEDAFLAVSVVANQGFPPRKNIDRIIKAHFPLQGS